MEKVEGQDSFRGPESCVIVAANPDAAEKAVFKYIESQGWWIEEGDHFELENIPLRAGVTPL